jgi:hypothetical protein
MSKVELNHKPDKKPTHKKCPKFEDAVALYLDNSDEQERALGFCAWLRTNKLSPVAGNSGYNWYISQNKQRILQLKMYNDTWYITTRWEIIDELISKEELKEVLWANICYCTLCNTRGCSWGTLDLDLFGREFKGVCRQFMLRIGNPDARTINLMKEFIMARKQHTS